MAGYMSSMAGYMSSKKTMEINPENAIMEELRKRAEADKNDKSVKDLIMLLFETLLLTSGFSLDDPNTFGNRIHRMLKLGLSIDEEDDAAAEADTDRPPLDDAEAEGSKMEEVLVGLRFTDQWPYIDRARVCFVEPPYFQMTVKPIFHHGVDVTEVPGIAGWLDKLIVVAFEQTLVEPNMLVVDMKKFASLEKENWFTMDEKLPIAFAKVEIIEAVDLKAADINGILLLLFSHASISSSCSMHVLVSFLSLLSSVLLGSRLLCLFSSVQTLQLKSLAVISL